MVENQPYYTQKNEHNFHATTTMKTKMQNEKSFLLYLKEWMLIATREVANLKYSIIIFKLEFFCKGLTLQKAHDN
jgi:hypothetical protein